MDNRNQDSVRLARLEKDLRFKIKEFEDVEKEINDLSLKISGVESFPRFKIQQVYPGTRPEMTTVILSDTNGYTKTSKKTK